MLRKITFIIMFLFMFISVAIAYEVPRQVLLTENFKRHYRDADKAWDDSDSLLCWAAVLSNMIAFTTDTDEDVIFNWFKKNVGNKPNSFLYGMLVLCKDYIGKEHETSCIPFVNMDYVNYYRTEDLRNWIIGSLIRNEIIGMATQAILGNWHAITVYGYEVDDDGVFYLYWTDSDDEKRMMYKDKVRFDPYGINVFASGALWGSTIYEAVSLSVSDPTALLEINREINEQEEKDRRLKNERERDM